MSEKKQSSPEPAALALQLCSWQRATPALQGPIPVADLSCSQAQSTSAP